MKRKIKIKAAALLTLVIALASSVQAFANAYYCCGDAPRVCCGYAETSRLERSAGYGWFSPWALISLLLLAFIVYKFYKGVAIANRPAKEEDYRPPQINGANASALEILGQKFAEGAISEEEYLRKRDLLK